MPNTPQPTTPPESAPAGRPDHLVAQLQRAAERLALASTSGDILETVLDSAQEGLSHHAGTVLLAQGDDLRVAAQRGQAEGTPSIWQGRGGGDSPAAYALRMRTPLFFERRDRLVAAFPGLEADIAARLAEACAAVPMVLDGQALGVLALDFPGAHEFSPAEVHFLGSLAAQGAVALGRAQLQHDLEARVAARTTELEEERAALDAFVAYKEAVGSESDVLVIARQAIRVVHASLEHVSAAYYELEDGFWKARVWSDDIAPDIVAQIQHGVPQDAPHYAEAACTHAAVFVDGWDASANGVQHAETYGAAAFLPLIVRGNHCSLFSVGVRDARAWTEREKALVRAVARGLTITLERTEITRQLQAQNAELDARTRALEAFAELTAELGVLHDPYALVQRAQEVTLALLGPGYGLYYERDDDRWRNRVQTGDVGNAELQAFIDEGPLVGHTPSVDIPWTTRTPYYQDLYAKGSDTPAEMVQHVNAAASLPVLQRGGVVGVFIAVLFEGRAWTRTDRVVLETVTRSLELALVRAEQTRQLEGRAALDAFVALTEAVGSDLDVHRVAERAMEVLRAFLPELSVGYYDLVEGTWQPTVIVEETGALTGAAVWAASLLDTPRPVDAADHPAIFLDSGDARGRTRPAAATEGAVAVYPYPDGTAPTHLLVIGTSQPRAWTSRERAMFLAVGRSLGLALNRIDRAESARLEALNAKNAELQAANEELEAFAYSVSHDLMTPVRHIAGFAQLARRTLDDPVKTTRALDVIEQAAHRMNSLIGAMLHLSRTGRQPMQRGPVDLDALVAMARLDVADDVNGRPVEWQVERLPVVQGDRETLQQVVTNLITNAVKYTRRREHPLIRVWAREDANAWTMYVQDNGAGFDPRYAHKLFGIFQRLHNQDDFEGTGVGLANVRRIVTRHGGTVHAHGVPDEGATFSFTLPKVP